MKKSKINIEVALNNEKMPEVIEWSAPDGGIEQMQQVKAILLGLWNGDEKTAMRIDLWTTKMLVDEMNDFFYQTLFGMADTYERATHNTELAQSLKAFAKDFHTKAMDLLKEQ